MYGYKKRRSSATRKAYLAGVRKGRAMKARRISKARRYKRW